MNLERGQVYRVNLNPTFDSEQRGEARPCVILTINAFARKLRDVTVVPLTSSPRALPPLIVSVPSVGKAEAMALCHPVRTIDKARIGKYVGVLSPQDLAAVEEGVRAMHGL